MKRIDYHTHTKFSFDSEENPENHILKAIEENLEELCFTDHQDFHYPIDDFTLDASNYFKELRPLQEKYRNKITIKIGVEIGLDRNYKKEIDDFINSYPFDFVIGSIHVINDTEFYYGDYFKNKTKEQAHRQFFQETLQCVQSFDDFNVLGHLDYIQRYGPYKDKSINYYLYQDIIDEILKTLIQKNKGIEVNTSGYVLRKDSGFPNYDIVERYYKLGGRIITIGTDSHQSIRIGSHVDEVITHLKTIGFKDLTTFRKREIEYGII